MTPKEAIEKIRGMLFADQPEVVSVAMAEFPLKDGGVVVAEKLEVGVPVTLNGEPAPDGTHTLATGVQIVVASGLITEVKQPQVEVEVEVPATEIEAGMKPKPEEAMAIQFASISEIEILKSKFSNQEKTIKELFSLVEKLADASIEKPKELVKSWDDMTPLERFRASKHN